MIQGPGSSVPNYFNEDHIADVAKLWTLVVPVKIYITLWHYILAIATLNNIT